MILVSTRQIFYCLEFLQFFQVSLAASTNWCLKFNFYWISDNKYINKSDSFLKKTKKWRSEMIPKNGRFLAETGGWYLCDIELPLQIFNSIFLHLVFVLFNFILFG